MLYDVILKMNNENDILRHLAQLTVELNATQKLLIVLSSELKIGTEDCLDMLEKYRATEWEEIENQNPSFAAFASEESTIDLFKEFKTD